MNMNMYKFLEDKTVFCELNMTQLAQVSGVSAADIFFFSYILITCRDGGLQPNIFLQTRWCNSKI